MNRLQAFLAYGMFPPELPPPFNSSSFGNLADPSFRTRVPKHLREGTESAIPGTHSLSRPGRIRRRLMLVNPVWHFALSSEISRNWRWLLRHTSRSWLSLSRPTDETSTKYAYKRLKNLDDLPRERAQRWSGARYVVDTDIARFFPSIYTHSLPWALHGKPESKKRRNDSSLLGNRLDKLVRRGQDNQTLGVPVGPATSHIISEVLLSAVDREIQHEIHGKGFRYVDDYQFAFNSYSHAEEFLHVLEEGLSKYELELNSTKTSIRELPQPIEEPWISELRTFVLGGRGKKAGYQLMHFFARAFEMFSEDKTRNVLRYAIGRLSSISIDAQNWPLLENLLLQAVLAEPGSLTFVIDEYLRYSGENEIPDYEPLKSVLSTLIIENVPKGHTSEVAWALWAHIVLGVRIESSCHRQLEHLTDPACILLCLDAQRRKLLPKSFAITKIQDAMTESELYGEHWLVSYEARVRRWLPTNGGGNHVNNDKAFRYLSRKGVHFYNVNAPEQYTPPKRQIYEYGV